MVIYQVRFKLYVMYVLLVVIHTRLELSYTGCTCYQVLRYI